MSVYGYRPDGIEKKPFFSNTMKIIIICILIPALIVSLGINIILSLPDIQIGGGPTLVTLLIGDFSDPRTMEPLDAWDGKSNDMFRYILEGLYMYDYTDPQLPLIPVLAADEGTWEDNITFTVNLKQDVMFHDGTEMNALDVKFTFDRMLYFLNASGTLPAGTPLMEAADLYKLPDGETSIIQNVEIIDADTVTFHLNSPYSIFKQILSYSSAHILSYQSAPATERHNFETPVVGTGPFILTYFVAGTEVRYSIFYNYHGDNAYFQTVVHAIIPDPTTRNNAMLTHYIDVLFEPIPSLSEMFNDDPTITYYQRGVEWGGPGVNYAYLGMNNHRINETWRSVISFAFDYDFVIDEIKEGTVSRAYSPLAPLFLPGFDQNELDVPYQNVTRAREYMVSMGFGDMGWSDAQWEAQATSAPFRTFNYTYNLGNPTREAIYPMLIDNLAKVGCTVDDANTGFSWMNDNPLEPTPIDNLGLFFIELGPKYFDPFAMLFPLFSNGSRSNFAQSYDPQLDLWFEEVLSETNDTMRTRIYEDMLTRIVEVIRPHCFCYHSNGYYVHSTDLFDVSYNAMEHWWSYPIWRNTTVTAALDLPRGTVGHIPPPWAGTVGP